MENNKMQMRQQVLLEHLKPSRRRGGGLCESSNLLAEEVGDIVVGSVLAPGPQRANECRMAAFFLGFPETVPVRTVNRQYSSELQAVADVAAAIKAGFYDIGIGAGWNP
ncbi:unnamed protein product [Sphagnum troendelagicum]